MKTSVLIGRKEKDGSISLIFRKPPGLPYRLWKRRMDRLEEAVKGLSDACRLARPGERPCRGVTVGEMLLRAEEDDGVHLLREMLSQASQVGSEGAF